MDYDELYQANFGPLSKRWLGVTGESGGVWGWYQMAQRIS